MRLQRRFAFAIGLLGTMLSIHRLRHESAWWLDDAHDQA